MGVKVSIIMPSLNVGNYIDEAVRSARSQTLRDIEIICVDAGSTDGTRQILDRHALQDNRIILMDSGVRSYGYQVNLGLRRASGEYAAVLETDDSVSPHMYERLYRMAVETGCDYIKCDYYASFTGENGARSLVYRTLSTAAERYRKAFTPRRVPATGIEDWRLWNGIYRMEFLRRQDIRLSETPGAAFQDIGFLHLTASAAGRVQYLKEALYHYCCDRPEASSQSGKSLAYIFQEYGLLMEKRKQRKMCGSEEALLFRRMAYSYLLACLEKSRTGGDDGQTEEAVNWFHALLSDAAARGFLRVEDLPESLRPYFSRLMVSYGDFAAYLSEQKERFYAFLGSPGEHPLILFGCGQYGREALRSLRGKGFRAAAFMDNDSSCHGRIMDGIPVVGPERIPELAPDTKYVIANEKYAADIQAQIRNIREEAGLNTFCFSPYLL